MELTHLIIKISPVMYHSGGVPFSDQEEKVSEVEFWDRLKELYPQTSDRKTEIETYLLTSNEHYVQVGDIRFKFQR